MTGMSAPVEDLPGWDSLPAESHKQFLAADLPAAMLQQDESVNFALGPTLAEADMPGIGRVLRFGYGTGLFAGEFCLDSATGEVKLARPDDLPPNFVNSSLEQFGRSVRVVLDHEDDLTHGDPDTCADAAQEVRGKIAAIDPPADRTDTYWDALYYELADGTYSDF
ncbi:SUKH-4 family immunity protein [Actinoplanes sp. CA-142083]|uniref:SUKH-4 family immunity protein n=1 Tax=Actinoplanes sp. CA-142083 TaxID=3239903 RepID=UPI003D8B1E20